MAMHIRKSLGLNYLQYTDLLNNIFLNIIMENIRKKYICKNQIKKGIGGIRKLLILKDKIIQLHL